MPDHAPQAFEWRDDAPWQQLEFISDLHLNASMPRSLAGLEHLLRTSSAQALIILGDFFEVWVGDDSRHGEFEQRCVRLLAHAAKQRPIGFMVGNRDFLVGPELLGEAGLTALPDPSIVNVAGQRLLLSHGDALCLADEPYQHFRAMVRSADWQRSFLAQPLLERREIAARIRRESQSRRGFEGAAWADVDGPAALAWLRHNHAQVMVHGHTHKPGRHVLDAASGASRVVLSDWDLDDTASPRAEVLRVSVCGFERIAIGVDGNVCSN